jgi:hypothetical protein
MPMVAPASSLAPRAAWAALRDGRPTISLARRLAALCLWSRYSSEIPTKTATAPKNGAAADVTGSRSL